MRHTVSVPNACALHVQFSLAYVEAGVFLLLTTCGACRLVLSGLLAAVRAFCSDEVSPLALPHLHCHQFRLPQGVLGLVGHVAFCFVPAHYL